MRPVRYPAIGQMIHEVFHRSTHFHDVVWAVEYDDVRPFQRLGDRLYFVADEARNYIIKNANHINFRLWKNEISLNEYDALENTPGDHHIGRAILECLGNGEKKVTIHLLKDGVSFEGKISADALRRSDGYAYSDYSLDASDRRRFSEAFGRNARILPNDIVKIIYGKKTLYERETFLNLPKGSEA